VGKPSVAFLVHRIPYPPNKGDKIRTYHQLQALRGDAAVTVACFVDNPADWAHIDALKSQCDALIAVPLRPTTAKLRSLRALPTRTPLSIAYYRSAEMRERLRDLGPFDAILAFSSVMVPYAEMLRADRRVLDLCDLDSEKWAQYAAEGRPPMSWIHALEAKRLGRYEAEAASRFDATLLVSEAEAETLRARAPGADVRTVPNGVDLDHLDPRGIEVEPDPNTAVFCGAMDYYSNEDAVVHYCERILPRVRESIPEAKLRIIGANPTPRVRALEEIGGVTVTGIVPDVRPEILRGSVSVAPLRLGRGVPNKILEALALELPVVTTPNGAVGLDLGRFAGAEVARDDDGFADAVVRRLRDRDGTSVRRFPEHREALRELYSWSRHARMLHAALDGRRS